MRVEIEFPQVNSRPPKNLIYQSFWSPWFVTNIVEGDHLRDTVQPN